MGQLLHVSTSSSSTSVVTGPEKDNLMLCVCVRARARSSFTRVASLVGMHAHTNTQTLQSD